MHAFPDRFEAVTRTHAEAAAAVLQRRMSPDGLTPRDAALLKRAEREVKRRLASGDYTWVVCRAAGHVLVGCECARCLQDFS